MGSIRVTVATAGTVYLDGERIGDLRAGQSATLSDVETGSRRLEVRAEPEGYQIGDRGPAGGIVFYDKGRVSEGWRYLEAASSDLDGSMNWNDAMSAARSFRFGGYSDWRLPTKDELNLMYENLHKRGIGGLESAFYWSSSEDVSSHAWGLAFSLGLQGRVGKNFDRRVRAVRAFGP